jgi:hypothetical protein
MRQVKIFKTIETELWNLEKDINSWVQETGAKIVQVAGNIAPQTSGGVSHGFSASEVLVVVLYEPGN